MAGRLESRTKERRSASFANQCVKLVEEVKAAAEAVAKKKSRRSREA
jgi:hypothetical protein